MRKNVIQLLVNFGETDRAGIVYYPNYYKWFDMATHQFFRSINMPLRELDDRSQIIVPLLDARCTFEKSLTDDDEITIVTSIAEVNHKTLKFAHEIFRNGERTSYGYEIRGWVKRDGGHISAVPIPKEVKELLCIDMSVK